MIEQVPDFLRQLIEFPVEIGAGGMKFTESLRLGTLVELVAQRSKNLAMPVAKQRRFHYLDRANPVIAQPEAARRRRSLLEPLALLLAPIRIEAVR